MLRPSGIAPTMRAPRLPKADTRRVALRLAVECALRSSSTTAGAIRNPARTARAAWLFATLLGVLLGTTGCAPSANPPSSPIPAGAPAATATVELPPEAVARNNRAVGLLAQFEFDAARETFAELHAAFPEAAVFQRNLAVAILNRQNEGDLAQAEQLLDELLKRHPDDLRALYCRGLLRLYAGRASEALRDLVPVVYAHRDDAYAAYFLGQALSQFPERRQSALDAYSQARASDPLLRSAWYGEFSLEQAAGNSEDAEAALAQFERLAGHPQAKLAEFKYTRAGPLSLGERIAAAPPAAAHSTPGSPVLKTAELPVFQSLPDSWTESAGPWSITATQLVAVRAQAPVEPGAVLLLPSGVSLLATKSSQAGETEYQVSTGHPLGQVPGVRAAAWGDYDDDGRTDVYWIGAAGAADQLWRQTADQVWQVVEPPLDWPADQSPTADAIWLDLDHDGDLDLVRLPGNGPAEWLRNNRDGQFQRLPIGPNVEPAETAPTSAGQQLLAFDWDSDRDFDLLVVRRQPPHELWSNELAGQFQPGPAAPPLTAEIAAAAAADLDADGRAELLAITSEGLGYWRLSRPTLERQAANRWIVLDDSIASQPGSTAHLEIGDLDADGQLDVAATAGQGVHLLLLARGAEGALSDNPHQLQVAPDRSIAAFTLAVLGSPPSNTILAVAHSADGGNDAPTDPSATARAATTLLAAHVESGHRSLAIWPLGQARPHQPLRTNASGLGVRLLARAAGQVSIHETVRTGSGIGQGRQPVHVGLGSAEQLDALEILWPDGTQQTELDLPAGQTRVVAELERQTSSCPLLFVREGEAWRFVTDLLGTGGVGAWSPGPGGPPPDPSENLVLPAALSAPRSAPPSVLLAEPMQEIGYLDHVGLEAYDLPDPWRLVLDERFATGPPQPTGQPWFYRAKLAPQEARNERGELITDALAAVDGRAAPPGPLDPRFLGRLATAQVIELRFDRPLDAHPGQPVLLAQGWIEYPYSQTVYAAWQAGAAYEPPTLQARDAVGHWHTLLPAFGYPAGMPRAMAVPLRDLPAGTQALRISSNQEIYWDHLSIVWAEQPPDLAIHGATIRRAELQVAGFPKRTLGPQRLPGFDWSRRQPLWNTWHPRGWYTRLGSVAELLTSADDELAIFGPGEAIEIDFALDAPPPRTGWSRTWVLKTLGWCKDQDLYTRQRETVEPVPRGTASATQGPPAEARTDEPIPAPALVPTPPARQGLEAATRTRYASGP